MRKKILSTLLLGILTSQSYALTDGLYLGFGIGSYGYHGYFTLNDVDSATSSDVGDLEGTSFGVSGLFSVGYSMPVSEKMSLAVQADAEIESGKATPFKITETNSGVSEVNSFEEENRYSVGVSLLPQWIITPNSNVFFKLGYRHGRFETTASETGSNSTSKKDWRNGVEYGLGTQMAVAQDFDIRLSASQVYYFKETLFTNQTPFNLNSDKTIVNRAVLSLIWHTDLA